MLSKILVGIDGSQYADKAFEYAIILASRCKSNLLIVNVLEEYGNVGYSISKELERHGKELLEMYRQRAEKSGLSSVAPMSFVDLVLLPKSCSWLKLKGLIQ